MIDQRSRNTLTWQTICILWDHAFIKGMNAEHAEHMGPCMHLSGVTTYMYMHNMWVNACIKWNYMSIYKACMHQGGGYMYAICGHTCIRRLHPIFCRIYGTMKQ